MTERPEGGPIGECSSAVVPLAAGAGDWAGCGAIAAELFVLKPDIED